MYANKIVNKAKSYIGTVENPPGSNKVLFNTNYYGREVSGVAYPWCAAFVWDIFRMCGASELFYNGKKTAYCPTIENWGKKNKLTVAKSQGQKGDIILFDFYKKNKSVHVGIIESKNKDGSYTTIEGNTSLSSDDNGGAVMRRTRKQNVVRCIIRPKYLKEIVESPKTVKEVQQYLNSKINARLNVDGYWGPNTRRALIKYWQKVVGGLDVDGSFGPKSRAKAYLNNLDKGDRGELVKIMQMALICRGYAMATYGADGSFGNYTEAVLEEYQKDKGLVADGICGTKTWTELFK